MKFVRDFSLQLPFDRPARFGSGRKCFRNCGIDHLLPFLTEAVPVQFGGVNIHSNENCLKIGYDQTQSIVIAVQSYSHDAETVIRVLPNRVRISSKYDIHDGQLSDTVAKPSTGGRQQNTPTADIHLLLKMETFEETFLRIQVNGVPFLMFWRTEPFKKHQRKSVTVLTQHGYAAMQMLRKFHMGMSWNHYFDGVEPKAEAQAEPFDDEVGETTARATVTHETPAGEEVNEYIRTSDENQRDCEAVAERIVNQMVETAVKSARAPDAEVLNKYGFQRYFMTSDRPGGSQTAVSGAAENENVHE